MDKIWSFVMSLILSVALLSVVGFVVTSINGYDYNFASSVPIGVIMGVIIFIFGQTVTAKNY